ncbi:unnamed protein product, partial [Rotaria socialis]
MCYLLPFHALSKIPNCRRPPKAPMNTTARLKRFVTGIIAIGIGSAALAMSTANSIQIRQLNQEIITITNSLTTLDAITTTHTTQLLQLQAGQLKLAIQLFKRLCKLKYEEAVTKYHFNSLKQYIPARLASNSFQNQFMGKSSIIDSAQDITVRKKLSKHYIEVAEQAKTDIMILARDAAERQMPQYQTKYNMEMNQVW